VTARRRIPSLLAISDRRFCGGDSDGLVRWARSLPAGIAIQLREKDLGRGELVSLGRSLRAGFRGVLIVNGHLDVALACRADGVHLPTTVSWQAVGAHVREQGLLLGVSTHGRGELERAVAAGADYALFGPIFDSPEKRRYGQPLGLARLRRAVKVGVPLLAVGGVDAQNAAAIANAGTHGLAAIRAFSEHRAGAEVAAAWRRAAATIPRS